MNTKTLLGTLALVVATALPTLGSAQVVHRHGVTVVRHLPHRTVVVHHPYHHRVVVVRHHKVYHHPHRTVIIHH